MYFNKKQLRFMVELRGKRKIWQFEISPRIAQKLK
jgi:hypothetical protein